MTSRYRILPASALAMAAALLSTSCRQIMDDEDKAIDTTTSGTQNYQDSAALHRAASACTVIYVDNGRQRHLLSPGDTASMKTLLSHARNRAIQADSAMDFFGESWNRLLLTDGKGTILDSVGLWLDPSSGSGPGELDCTVTFSSRGERAQFAGILKPYLHASGKQPR